MKAASKALPYPKLNDKEEHGVLGNLSVFPADAWLSSDIVDCIISYAATELVNTLLSTIKPEGPEMLQTIKQDPQASKQVLLLAHLYAKIDSASLARLRQELFQPKYSAKDIAVGTAIGATALTGTPFSVYLTWGWEALYYQNNVSQNELGPYRSTVSSFRLQSLDLNVSNTYSNPRCSCFSGGRKMPWLLSKLVQWAISLWLWKLSPGSLKEFCKMNLNADCAQGLPTTNNQEIWVCCDDKQPMGIDV